MLLMENGGVMERLLKNRKRMFLVFWGSVALIAFLLWQGYHRISGILYEDMQNRAESAAYAGMLRMQTALEGDLNKLDAYTARIGRMSLEEILRINRSGFGRLKEIADYDLEYVVGPGGTVYVDGVESYDISDQEYYRDGIDKDYTFISSPFTDPLTGRRSIAMLSPVRNEAGELICHYGINISLAHLSENFNSRPGQDENHCFICDRQGEIIVQTEKPETEEEAETVSDLFRDAAPELAEAAVDDMTMAINLRKSTSMEMGGYYISYIPFDVGQQSGWMCISFVSLSPLNWDRMLVLSYLSIICLGCFILFFFLFLVVRAMSKDDVQTLERLFYKDELTGLYNHMYMLNKGGEYLAQPGVKALCYFDINDFNLVNDLYDRIQGDQILKLAGSGLLELLENGEMGVRVASDHFMCIIRGESEEELRARIEQIYLRLEQKMESAGLAAGLSLAFGAYLTKPEDTNLKVVLNLGDLARKAAKEKKLHGVLYYDRQMEEKRVREARHESELRKALANHEFVPYLQPQLNFSDGQVFGAEALARWVDKEGRVHYPDEFIPYFEESGLIERLEFEMIGQVCQLKREWKRGEEFKDLRIAVNLSRRVIGKPDFADHFLQLAREYELGPGDLELEITETVYMQDFGFVRKNIHRLRQEGFRFAIDDFGSGYSTLETLVELEMDLIKIDKDFLRNEGQKMESIVRGIIALAKELRVEIICEGVETAKQERMLKGFGCDFAQGYLYSRPVDRESFECWCRGRRKSM